MSQSGCSLAQARAMLDALMGLDLGKKLAYRLVWV